VTEAVLGGLTVLAKLAPALVAVHLVVAMLVLAGAVTLHWLAGHGTGPHLPATGWEVRLLARLLLLVLGAVIVLGTVATGAGPDAGGPDVPRFGFRFQAAAELHAVAIMFLCGLAVAMFFALRPGTVTRPVLRAYAMLLLATVLQGAVGYVQYFGGLPAGLVEARIVGAGILVIASVRFNLALGPGALGVAQATPEASPGTPCRLCPAARPPPP
jgi:cytochrome c oxidase assembly protein subunit 15